MGYLYQTHSKTMENTFMEDQNQKRTRCEYASYDGSVYDERLRVSFWCSQEQTGNQSDRQIPFRRMKVSTIYTVYTGSLHSMYTLIGIYCV